MTKEKIYKVFYVTLVILGIMLIIYGEISYLVINLTSILSWSGFLGMGLGLYGATNILLISMTYLQDNTQKKSNENIVITKDLSKRNMFIAKYITNKNQLVVLIFIYLACIVLISLGAVNFVHWF